MHRVLDLADRAEPAVPPLEPESALLLPLTQIISQITGSAPTSRAVHREYENTLQSLGPELDILRQLPLDQIRAWREPLGVAIARMRAGKIELEAGFDGQYGKAKIFDASELAEIRKLWPLGKG